MSVALGRWYLVVVIKIGVSTQEKVWDVGGPSLSVSLGSSEHNLLRIF